jgi:beta-galactosidase GanA
MFVNAALNRPGAQPGQYPSGGPLPHLFDVWRAGAPSIDLLAPDIYLPNFQDWTARYARADNPLFIPEARKDEDSGVNALYAVGAYGALGFSPFAIETIENPGASPLAESYRLLSQLAPLIVQQTAQAPAALAPPAPGHPSSAAPWPATMTAVLLDKETPVREITLGGYRVRLAHDYTWEWSGPARLGSVWPRAGAVIINTDPGNYIFAGTGVIATFVPELGPVKETVFGIEKIEEGRYQDGKWIAGRRLNGDENHQGRQLRLPAGAFGMQRIWLYRAN